MQVVLHLVLHLVGPGGELGRCFHLVDEQVEDVAWHRRDLVVQAAAERLEHLEIGDGRPQRPRNKGLSMLLEAALDDGDQLVPVLSKPLLPIAFRQPIALHHWQYVLSELGVQPLGKVDKRVNSPTDHRVVVVVA